MATPKGAGANSTRARAKMARDLNRGGFKAFKAIDAKKKRTKAVKVKPSGSTTRRMSK